MAEQPSLRRASGLLAVSAATRDEFVQNYGVSPERIALARNSIDSQFFTRRPNAAKMRAHYGLEHDEPVILFAGFVTPRKGLRYLAEALPLIRPRARLLVAGRWSAPDRTRFKSMIGQDVDCLVEAGFVPDEQMPDLYSIADVYVSPTVIHIAPRGGS